MKQTPQEQTHPSEQLNNEEQKYVQPKNIELVLTKEQREKCRQIVAEINRFGVSQREKIFICGLLALELEDLEVRNSFDTAVKMARSKLKEELKIESVPKKKLIL